jgi:hypothetical protein
MAKKLAKKNPSRRAASVTFTSRVDLLGHLPGMHYLEIPASAVRELGGTFKLRVICRVASGPRALEFRAGLMALGGGKAYISITKRRMKELGLGQGGRPRVTLRPDRGRYGMEMPAELRALLEQDEVGRARFAQLSPGKQRYVIFYVSGVKSEERRLDRAVLLIENLKRLPLGKETFRQMLGLPPRTPRAG